MTGTTRSRKVTDEVNLIPIGEEFTTADLRKRVEVKYGQQLTSGFVSTQMFALVRRQPENIKVRKDEKGHNIYSRMGKIRTTKIHGKSNRHHPKCTQMCVPVYVDESVWDIINHLGILKNMTNGEIVTDLINKHLDELKSEFTIPDEVNLMISKGVPMGTAFEIYRDLKKIERK